MLDGAAPPECYALGMMDAKPLDRAAVEDRLRTDRIGRPLLLLDTVGSTMDIARAEAEAGVDEGLAVLAEEQTAGRGRLQRSWVSPKSANLHITLVLRPDLATLRKLSMLTALAVTRSLRRACDLEAGIKWPNDALARGRKIAGVLIENELEGDSVRYALVGVGINVNFDARAYPEIADIATSAAAEIGHHVSREAVLAEFLNAFEELYRAAASGADVRAEWRAGLVTLGQQVRVTFAAGSEEGTAEDVDADGSLIVRRVDGTTVAIAAGDVTLRE